MKTPHSKFKFYSVILSLGLIFSGCTSAIETSPQNSCTHTSGQAPCNFGVDGVIEANLGVPNQWGAAIARQSDGKLVVVSVLIDYGDLADMGRVGVVRFLTDGTIDTSFANLGKYITSVDNTNNWLDGNWVGGVAIQSDGKIVFSVGNQAMTVMRLTSAGALDTTFGTGGTFQDAAIGRANQVAIQADGKIVVGTTNITMSNGQLGVARLNSNGTLDATFGTGGVSGFESSQMPGENMAADHLAIQSDGKILVTSKLLSAGGGIHLGFEVTRLNTNGALDNTFGNLGQATVNFGAGYSTPWGLEVQSDGKIVMAGRTQGTTQIAVVKFLSDGALDSAFGTSGIFSTTSVETAGALGIESDSKIFYAAGSNILRLTTTGILDTTWGTSGSLAVPSVLGPNAMLVTSDQVILLGSGSTGATVVGAAVLAP